MKNLFKYALLAVVMMGALAVPASAQNVTNYQPNDVYTLTATVASGQTVSGAIDLMGTDLTGIFVPAEFDGTTITLQAATSLAGTYVAVQDGAGNAVTLTTTASRYVPISNLALITGLRYVKLVCGSSQTTTDSVFTIAARPI